MCILLKLDYAKFGVSNLLFQKLSKIKLCRSPLSPLLKEGLRHALKHKGELSVSDSNRERKFTDRTAMKRHNCAHNR